MATRSLYRPVTPASIGAIPTSEKGAPLGVPVLSANGFLQQERGVRGATVRSQVAQSIPTGAGPNLATFDTKVYDSGGFVDLIASNSQIVVPAGLAGWYLLGAFGLFAGNAVGYRALEIRINNVGVARLSQTSVSAASFAGGTVAKARELAAGDVITLNCLQTSGANLDLGLTLASEVASTMLQVVKIGPPSADGL